MIDAPTLAVPEDQRLSNVLIAFAVAMTDKINTAIRTDRNRSHMAAATLIQIGFNPGLSIERLRGMIGLSHSATVRIIDQLEGDGLVIRERNPRGDLRVASLFLTQSGMNELELTLEHRRRIVDPIFANLDPTDLAALRRILDKAMPAVVDFGLDQDVVCRLCDLSTCPQDQCPVNICVHARDAA